MFEKHYSEEQVLWGLFPDRWLAENIKAIPVGKALDLGVGEGRNALFLAQEGFQVTGVDVSAEAIRKFLNLAGERGLTVNGLLMDIRDFDFKVNAFELIVASSTLHFFTKSEVGKIILKINGSTVPKGYVYIKDFTVFDPSYQTAQEELKQIEENTFYSSKLSSYVHFFRPNELKEMFTDFEIKLYIEEILKDPGHGKSGPHEHGAVVLLAQKKDAP